jgi:RNA polymerase-associated protein RTF1
MLARKNEMQAGYQSAAAITMERARLNQKRTLAIRRQDSAELAEIDVQLAALNARTGGQQRAQEQVVDVLAKVNARNRAANVEAVRKAELAEAERKRRDRKLAAQGIASGRGTPVPLDPSARLKTTVKLSHTASRAGTPSTPVLAATQSPGSRPITPLPYSRPQAQKGGFEAAVIDSIEVNLGDF